MTEPRAGMTLRTSLLRTLVFTALYVFCTWAGRLTVMDETNLSMVWPAAGVSAVWFLAQWRSRWRWLDALALSAVTMVVNTATGAPAVLALWFVVANLAQAGSFAVLFRRWLPALWGGGGDRQLSRPQELWRLVAAAFLSTAVGALIGPTGVWVVNGVYSGPATAVWLTRNTVSILLIGAAGLRVGYLIHRRGAVRLGRIWTGLAPVKRLEYVVVMALSIAVYTAVFGSPKQLPLTFSVIVMTVWAGTRLHTGFVILHDLAFGTVAVLYTLAGLGPFALIDSNAGRALVAQAFVGMISVVGLALALGRDERQLILRDLRSAQEAAAAQAQLMTTIVDSMTEGLTVMDEQGRILLRNPAVRRLTGGVSSPTGAMRHPDFYGLSHPDGTPLKPDELPHRRALEGDEVRGMDVLIRNPGLPDGRILSVNSTPIAADAAGRRYAVTVFHDVTSERRHRTELANFAGVVAHDLLNPLATIDGWSEALAEVFADTPGHPASEEAEDGIRRIRRASARMRDMINDLLAFTTARDATIAPSVVDLGAVVNDIAIARIDQAQSTGAPPPGFHIGELGGAYADPVLVRQLLENLISNSIKYTAPGVTPEITIAAARENHMVTLTLDDNGIGIPADQQDSVFENFQRAHRGAGYSGTGLGLGICRKIVERHGGTIRAADNPAGRGSRFTFTLPVDATGAPRPDEEPPKATTERRAVPPSAPTPAPAGTFAQAAHLVLEYLHESMPLAFWAVTRVENGRQTYLYLDDSNGYGLHQGDSHPWEDSFCVHMAARQAPAVALDAQAVELYAGAGVNDLIQINTYAGAVISEPDGSVFGAICGLDPHSHTGDARMAGAEPLLALLGRLLTAALSADRAQDRSAGALLREQVSADTDPLTGLPNRRAWQRLLDRAEKLYERLADPTVVVMIDLDKLKAINDSQGHTAGDAYIKAAATALAGAVRETDVVARLGGDEFGVLLPQCTEADAEAVMARMRLELEGAAVAASIGWTAVTPKDGFAAALERADANMYAEKRRHRADAQRARDASSR
ncbi:diguanylate cyclase [Actinoplanes sp. NPDC049596]|uniref:diguanylate cyclase domain-containing protein n=1 Tax=unclassified Actinoplanes TaxID=2626549 RepID=UPI003438B395